MYESVTVIKTPVGSVVMKYEVADTEKEASEKGFSHVTLDDELLYQTVTQL